MIQFLLTLLLATWQKLQLAVDAIAVSLHHHAFTACLCPHQLIVNS